VDGDQRPRAPSARVSCGREWNGAAAGCRTPHHKTHGTEAPGAMVVAYAWHPWVGQFVQVHEMIERPTGARARCSLAGGGVVRTREMPVRMREMPVWILNAAACRGMRDMSEPVAALAALAALTRCSTSAQLN
jgi:hypothetical protein